MMRLLSLSLLLLLCLPPILLAQDAHTIIQMVRQKQATIHQITYSVDRTDTLVTGTIRHFSGQVSMQRATQDRLFGFRFRATQTDLPGAILYDGHVGYVPNEQQNTYSIVTDSSRLRTLLYQAGGRLVMPDLLQLDTSKAIRFGLTQDRQFYYLTLFYANLEQYDVVNRYKTIQVDRSSLLPMLVRQHQETLGKVQDLCYRIRSITMNNTTSDDFRPPLPATIQSPKSSPTPIRPLLGQQAPPFRLLSLDGDSVQSSALAGKITLLDFWEVWCGPCLTSMPHIVQLYQRYHSQGFQVYGITHDLQQLEAVRRYVARHRLPFPTLIGAPQVQAAFQLRAIPLYVLIDRHGRIAYVGEGFSDEMEKTIQTLLQQ